jgi:hypothetical protein
MPILNDIPDHEVIGPEIKKGIQMGELQGELKILRRQIRKRFGTVPNLGGGAACEALGEGARRVKRSFA